MTSVLDSAAASAPTSTVGYCPTPEKMSFATKIAAMAFAAEHDAINGTNNQAYECTCNSWHNTSSTTQRKKMKTASNRIALAAAAFPDAPLHPDTALAVGFYNLTPKIAAYWLTVYNVHNRDLRDRGVTTLGIDMTTGAWEFNGDTFCFDVDRILIDGQHRCEAIADSGITVPIILVTGLEPVAQDTIDTGSRRLFADALKLAGESDWNNLAAITTQVFRWKAGEIRGGNFRPSIKILQRVLRDHPEIRDTIVVTRRVKARIGPVPASVIGLASWLFHTINAADHDDFFTKLVEGAGLNADDPIWQLREVLRDHVGSKRRLPNLELLALVIKAWNYYRSGATVKNLRWRSGGHAPEAFPEPR